MGKGGARVYLLSVPDKNILDPVQKALFAKWNVLGIYTNIRQVRQCIEKLTGIPKTESVEGFGFILTEIRMNQDPDQKCGVDVSRLLNDPVIKVKPKDKCKIEFPEILIPQETTPEPIVLKELPENPVIIPKVRNKDLRPKQERLDERKANKEAKKKRKNAKHGVVETVKQCKPKKNKDKYKPKKDKLPSESSKIEVRSEVPN
jgi:hypothetical protein